MYRITYTYVGPDGNDGIRYYQRRTIQYATSYAFSAYEQWKRNPLAQDVVLEMWGGTEWVEVRNDRATEV